MTLPLFITRIRSAFLIVESRCATINELLKQGKFNFKLCKAAAPGNFSGAAFWVKSGPAGELLGHMILVFGAVRAEGFLRCPP